MRLAVATFVAFLALASPAVAQSVSNVTVDNATPSNAAGARTIYVVEFTTSANGVLSSELNSRINVNFPDGTTFTGGTTSDVQVGTNDVGGCFGPSGLTIQCFLDPGDSIAGNTRVRVTIGGVTNPSAPGPKTLTVSTTADPQAVGSSGYGVLAAGTISAVTLSNFPPSRAAGARTIYVTEFTTSATGGMSDAANSRITLGFPTGTTFTGGTTSDVRVGTTDVGGCFGPVGLTIECFLDPDDTVAPSARVTVTVTGVTNTTTVGPARVAVATTSDPQSVNSAPADVVAAGTVSAVTLTNFPPSRAAGARTIYVTEFTTSATGGMSDAANSRITLGFPTGTTFTGGTTSDVRVGTTDVGGCFGPVGLTIECFLDPDDTVAPSARVTVTVTGVTNTTTVGPARVAVATTSDPQSVNSAPADVVAAGTVSAVTLTNFPPSRAAGARTIYVTEFTTSATGGMSDAANSRITLGFPTGTTFTGGTTSDVRVGTTDVGGCFGPVGLTIECFLDPDDTVAPSARVTVTVTGVTNTTTVGPARVAVATTSDPQSVNSAPADVVAAGTVSAVTLTNFPPSRAAGARTIYVTEFTTSATGGMSDAANSRITLGFPTGTTFTGGTTSDVRVGTTDVGGCFGPVGLTIECFLDPDDTVAPSARVTVTVTGVTNTTTVGPARVAVATTSDPQSVNSGPTDVASGNSLSAVTVNVANPAASATTQYVTAFTTSATGGLSNAANSRITITFPGGATFPGGTTSDVRVGTTDVGGCFGPVDLTIECFLDPGDSVAAGDRVTITIGGVRNPATAGTYAIRASTTSDRPPVESSYQVGQDTVAPETTLGAGGPPFAFVSNEPGSTFRCRIDGGALFTCASPYTPSALAPGEHEFAVHAVDGAGNADPTPATRRFTIAAPTPEPTPTAIPTVVPTPPPTVTPTPEPTPEFRQTVVVQPVRGTVRVRRPGSNEFVDLDAGAGIPLGATIDTKKGEVELTSLPAPGAPPQTARFRDGIFRVSQSGSTTDLTLTETLAPCSKRARAAAEKPKSRRLWGDGRGKFRTVGRYSAATVRGTEWLVQDTCNGTLVRVKQGVVAVRDKVKRRTVIVRAPRSYTAKPRR